MDLGHSWLFVVLLANNPICILFFKLNVRNVKCFSSGCSVLHSSSKSNLIYVNCPISLATSFLDETSLLRSLSVLERGKIKSPPTLVLPLGNCSSILDLCLRNSLAGKSRGHRDVIILENFSFKNVFHLDVVFSTRRLNLTWYASIAPSHWQHLLLTKHHFPVLYRFWKEGN